MAQLEIDRFTAWLRDRYRDEATCAEIEQILAMNVSQECRAYFASVVVQAQWEAWQAALANRPAKFWIPPGVYWNAEKQLFFSAKSGLCMGFNFQHMWSNNSSLFPTSSAAAYEVLNAAK